MGWATKFLRKDSNKKVLSELKYVKERGGARYYGKELVTDLKNEIARRKQMGIMKKSAGKKKRGDYGYDYGYNPFGRGMV